MALLLALFVGDAGCDRVVGLHGFSIAAESPEAVSGALHCSTHLDCQGQAAPIADYCHAGQCVALRTDDCQTVTGPANEHGAVLIGSVFPVSREQSQANVVRARQQSAMLAVEQINAAGGVRVGSAQALRPLALVSCDAVRDVSSATRHLIDDLGVRAIVGASSSPDAVSAISLAAASEQPEPGERAMSWLMVPTLTQQAPLLLAHIQALETQLRTRANFTARALRLAVVLRGDTLAAEARAALGSLGSDGQSSVRFDVLAADSDMADVVDEYATFAPDIVVLVGSAELVPALMQPLEQSWRAAERPLYVITEAVKAPALLALVRAHEELRARVSGIAVRPTLESGPNQGYFAAAYTQRFDADGAASFGAGQTYDSVYALVLAQTSMAAASRAGLEQSMRSLYSGATTFALRPENLAPAQDALANGQAIRALGSFAALRWDEHGALTEGASEVFCIAAVGGEPSYASSGLSFDIASQKILGAYNPCQSDAKAQAQPASADDADNADDADAGVPSCAGCDATPDAATPLDPPDAGQAPLPPLLARNLACGTAAHCGANDSEYCCIASSTAAPSCESEPRSCEHEFRCTRASDCHAGEQCCEQAGKASCMPATEACPGAKFDCVSARDCAAGQQCCSHLTADNSAYAATSCEAECDSAQNSAPLCESALDCAVGTICRVSNYLPNLQVCDVAR